MQGAFLDAFESVERPNVVESVLLVENEVLINVNSDHKGSRRVEVMEPKQRIAQVPVMPMGR